ncbi:hypothetical protein NW752_012298 [Fusarium irregulare]|uniref:Peptidase A1 domain-containing protein n=1 Tax=Fusarium irregulare TaxID=2494466 RepID=A0A9W8PQM6_9HYPO|nr:hypothetical protein NW752_012298 [Fusarium irregulare]KAJ4014809.1 hypothetical protein NW766_005124 [Fusarium irregulare]
MKSWLWGASLVSSWGLVYAQTIQWNIEGRHPQPHLARRSKTTYEEVIRNDRTEGGYFTEVTIGDPPQKITLQLDTGSSDVWVPWNCADVCTDDDDKKGCPLGSFDPDKSKSFKHVAPGMFGLTFVDDSYVKGDYFEDHFELDGAVINNLTMGLAIKTNISYGLIGVGYAKNEASSSTTDVIYPNLPVAMYESGYVNTIAYSVWLNDLDAKAGTVLFGGVDTSKYVGDMHRIDIQPLDGHYYHFIVVLTSLVATSSSGSDVLTSDGFPIKTVLDSGTTLSYLPHNLTTEIWKEVGAIWSPYYGVSVLPCAFGENEGNFTFGFAGPDGPSISVGMDELVLTMTSDRDNMPVFESGPYKGQTMCSFGIQNDTSELYLLGNTFLRSAYVVYDLVNNEVGIAATDFNSTATKRVAFKSYGASIPSATAVANQHKATENPDVAGHNYSAADGFQKSDWDTDDEDNVASPLTPSRALLATMGFVLLGGGILHSF